MKQPIPSGWNPTHTYLAHSLVFLAVTTATAAAAEPDLLNSADARIEKHRKGDAVVQVVDAAGKAAVGASVHVEQTNHAFLFGSNIYRWGRCKTPEHERLYRQRFAEVLNYATLPFYWNAYERQRGKPAHASREAVARWCKENGIATKGHPLAWNHADPPWLPDDPTAIMRLQLDRITDCVTRFKGLIERWDVVNEATHYDRESFWKRAPKMTKAWQHAGRLPFTKQCFHAARAANPRATLLINDYRTDPKYVELIEQLVDDKGKRLYDVIGIQSHMHGGVWKTDHIWHVCERFAQFGVPLHFTETTVVSGAKPKTQGGSWRTTEQGEARQARETVRFYTMLFSHPAVEAITWWDFSDQGAWKGAPSGWLRVDMSPKPVFHEMKRLIKGRWWTRLDAKTDAKGEVRFRGFKGEYAITVKRGEEGKPVRATLDLGKTGRATVKLGE